MLSRRTFLKTSALWVPSAYAAPGISFFGASSSASNGLLAATVGYWKMDEGGASGSRADATGNGWTASDTNNNVASIAGLINNGINISTQNKGLTVSSSIDTRSTSAPFSFQLWINPTVSFTNNFGLCAFYGGATFGWYIIENGAGAIDFHALDNAGNDSDVAINGMVIGTWQHIVVGYNGTSTIHVYRNTLHQSASLVAGQTTVTRGTNGLIIGNNQILSAGQTGIVDECAYFNKLLSQTDVNTLYNSGAGLPFSSYT